MKSHHSAGGVVLDEENEVVIITSQSGLVGLPKGRVNENESYINAAKREIYEETGLKDLELIKELGTYNRPVINESNIQTDEIKIIHIFLFKCKKMTFQPVTKDEVSQVEWVDKEEATELFTNDVDRQFYFSILKKIKT